MIVKQLNEQLQKLVELHTEVISVDEMKQLSHLLSKVYKVAVQAHTDGDYNDKEIALLKQSIDNINMLYGYPDVLQENIRLTDVTHK